MKLYVLDTLIWLALIGVLILGLINDIEHSHNHHKLLLKVPLILGFIYLFKGHKYSQWIILGMATIYPIVLYATIQRNPYQTPLFDHLLPAFAALLLLILKSFIY